MRALVQRVRRAEVRVGTEPVGSIGPGLCVLVGVTQTDDAARAGRLADRLAELRIFPDDDGATNRSLVETGGEVLVVSQFTLCADTTRGRRPSFLAAAPPEQAEPLIEVVVDRLRTRGVHVETGRFRAAMEVELVNDGPFTVSLEI